MNKDKGTPPAGHGTTDEAGLLRAIADDPDDDLPRLAHADWFEENGDPDRARLIRLQAASLDTAPSQEENDLTAANLDRWLGPLGRHATGATFEGGGLRVTVAARKFLTRGFQANAAGWFAQARAEGLCLDGRTGNWDRVAASPLLGAAPELCLKCSGLDFRSLNTLMGSPHLAGLYALELQSVRLGDDLHAALMGAALPRLRRLRLIDCRVPLGHVFLALLASWPPAQLTTLDLSYNHGPVGEVGGFVASPALAGLSRLDLSQGYASADFITAVASSPTFANLTRLRLSASYLDAEAARALASSPHLKKLVHLDVSHNRLRPEDAVRLVESPGLAACRRFDLRGCSLPEECQRDLRARFGDRVRLD